MTKTIQKPKTRSSLHFKLGTMYFGLKLKQMWFKNRKMFAKEFRKTELPYVYFKHQSFLMRKLKDVDM